MKKPKIQLIPHPIHSVTVKSAINARLSHIQMSAALQQRILNEINFIDSVDQKSVAPALPPVPRPAASRRKSKGYDTSQIAADIQRIKATASVPGHLMAPHAEQNILYINRATASRVQASAPIFWTPPISDQISVGDTAPPKQRFSAKRILTMLIAAILVVCFSFSILGATVPVFNDVINDISPEFAEFLGREHLITGRMEEIPPPAPLDDAVSLIDGIELRITEIQHDGANLVVFYTLRDTIGSRIHQDSDFQLLTIFDQPMEGRYLRRYDETTGILTVAAVFADCLIVDEEQGPLLRVKSDDDEDLLPSDEETKESVFPPEESGSLPDDETGEDGSFSSGDQREKLIPLAPDGEKLSLCFRQVTSLFEYAPIPIEIDLNSLPLSPSTLWLGSVENGFWPAEMVDGAGAALAQEALDTTGLEVLAPGDLEIAIEGLDFAKISHIGFVGQQLHIQVYFFDYDRSLTCGWESLLVGHVPENIAFDLAGLNSSLLYRVSFREDPELGEGNYFEYIYDLSPNSLNDQELFAIGSWEKQTISEDVWTAKASLASHESIGFEGNYYFEDSTITNITFTPYVIQLISNDRALHKSIQSLAVILDDGTELCYPCHEDSSLIIDRKVLSDGRYLITISILDLSGEQLMPDLSRIVALRINEMLIDPTADSSQPHDSTDSVEPDPDETENLLSPSMRPFRAGCPTL